MPLAGSASARINERMWWIRDTPRTDRVAGPTHARGFVAADSEAANGVRGKHSPCGKGVPGVGPPAPLCVRPPRAGPAPAAWRTARAIRGTMLIREPCRRRRRAGARPPAPRARRTPGTAGLADE